MAVDAALSPDTKAFLKNRFLQQGHHEGSPENTEQEVISQDLDYHKLLKQE